MDTKDPDKESQDPPKQRTCSVPGCSKKHLAKGMCDMHYSKQREEKKRRMETLKGPAVSPGTALSAPLPSASRRLVLDMTHIPGAEEILAEVRALGEKEFRPVEYHAAYLLREVLKALKDDHNDVTPALVEVAAMEAS